MRVIPLGETLFLTRRQGWDCWVYSLRARALKQASNEASSFWGDNLTMPTPGSEPEFFSHFLAFVSLLLDLHLVCSQSLRPPATLYFLSPFLLFLRATPHAPASWISRGFLALSVSVHRYTPQRICRSSSHRSCYRLVSVTRGETPSLLLIDPRFLVLIHT